MTSCSTPDECSLFERTVGLVEASIGRMVPVQTEEMKDGEPLRVCVEHYGYLPVDRSAFKGEIPEIINMVPFAPFDFYIKRKLYIHNMDHAACAYLGNILGLEYIYEAIGRPEIRILVQNAMLESAMALSQKYGVDLREIQMHITDLLGRFTNRALKDTCRRVGGDPARKLSPNDRMIGSSLLAMEQGITPVYICVGTAAGVYRYISETEEAKQSAQEAGKVLSCVSGMDKDHPLTGMILDYYGMLLAGKSLLEICQAADMKKGKTLGKVI